ncbi:MAG: sigma-70 domain-containing protein [Candidatus Aenigmatarchaeota archaeon]
MTLPKQEKELLLWKEWRRTGDEEKLEELMNSLRPLIMTAVNKWKGNLPQDILTFQAENLALKALHTYDPKKKVALSTHVMNNLLPLSRFVYTHQNIGRIPSEVRIAKINTLKTAIEEFQAKYGRYPNAEELSDTLGMSPKQIQKFFKELHPDLLESYAIAPIAVKMDPQTEMIVDQFYSSLSPIDKFIFEHSVGYKNKKKLTIREIATKLNKSTYEVLQRREEIARKLSEFIEQYEKAGISFERKRISASIESLLEEE